MNKTIITVSREFGSGGRSVAKLVAEALGIPYYDKELIKQVAEKTGLSAEYVENAGEYASGKTLLSYLPPLVGQPGFTSGYTKGMSATDFLWCMQRNVILELAKKDSCVIVGRCADYILKDFPNAFHVFIHAATDFRADRIVRLYGESEKKPEERLADKDAKRKRHYKHFTGGEWGQSQNYHLCLDSGVIGIERCAALIVDLVHDQQ